MYPAFAHGVHLAATVREECVNFADKEDSALMTTPLVGLVKLVINVSGEQEVKSNKNVPNLLMPYRVRKNVRIVQMVKYQMWELQVVVSVRTATGLKRTQPVVVRSANQVNMHKEKTPTDGASCVQMEKSIILILK